MQGEGDYEATRRYRKRTEEFLENNDVEKAAIRAAPEDADEAEELEAAEEAGKSRRQGRGSRPCVAATSQEKKFRSAW